MPCLEVFVMDTTQKTPSPRSAPNTGARRAAWRILQREGRRLEETPLRTLLENPGRPAQLRLEAAGLIADFSKQRIDDAVIDALIGVANRDVQYFQLLIQVSLQTYILFSISMHAVLKFYKLDYAFSL